MRNCVDTSLISYDQSFRINSAVVLNLHKLFYFICSENKSKYLKRSYKCVILEHLIV